MGRIPEVIAEFIRAKFGEPDTGAKQSEIKGFLNDLRMHMQYDLPSKRRVQLPDQFSMSRLFETTKPKQFTEKCNRDQLAIWLAIVLESLDPQCQGDVGRAEELLFPTPTANPEDTVPSSELARPLKPYEQKLKNWAEQMGFVKGKRPF